LQHAFAALMELREAPLRFAVVLPGERAKGCRRIRETPLAVGLLGALERRRSLASQLARQYGSDAQEIAGLRTRGSGVRISPGAPQTFIPIII